NRSVSGLSRLTLLSTCELHFELEIRVELKRRNGQETKKPMKFSKRQRTVTLTM
ncbi:MAG: hypothetical protein ACI8UO_001721, partial [Verrucomicrobiales bacterium]